VCVCVCVNVSVFSAARAAEEMGSPLQVTLLEATSKVLGKVKISGGENRLRAGGAPLLSWLPGSLWCTEKLTLRRCGHPDSGGRCNVLHDETKGAKVSCHSAPSHAAAVVLAGPRRLHAQTITDYVSGLLAQEHSTIHQ
jgi:hypothetical protein